VDPKITLDSICRVLYDTVPSYNEIGRLDEILP